MQRCCIVWGDQRGQEILNDRPICTQEEMSEYLADVSQTKPADRIQEGVADQQAREKIYPSGPVSTACSSGARSRRI